LNQRVISAAKGDIVGFLLAGLVVVCLTMTLGTIVSLSAWSSSEGFGSSSGWGLGAMCYVGTVVGVVLALRRKPARA
jgi:hypothetical protein